MTKIKALRDFLEKFFNYKSHGMTISEVLADVTENGEASGGGGGFNCDEVLRTIDNETVVLEKSDQDGREEYGAILSVTKKLLMSDDDARDRQKVASLFPKHYVVTFDGKTYDLPQNIGGIGIVYGEIGRTVPPSPAFNKYPVAIRLLPKRQESGRFNVGFAALSNLPGEHSIKIEESVSLVSTTPCFDDAVMKVMTDQNRAYDIPETKVETETMTEEIHDIGPVEFYYCDITNLIMGVDEINLISIGVTVDGITLEFNPDQFSNLQCESITEVSDILEQYGFAFMSTSEDDSQNYRMLMFFQDPGPHVISIFFNTKSDADGGKDTLTVVLNITYEQPEGHNVRYPKSVAFSKTYAEIMDTLDNNRKIAFTSADYPGISFMYYDHNESGYFEVYRLRPVSIYDDATDESKDYMMVETYELSSKNNKYASYKLIEVQRPSTPNA